MHPKLQRAGERAGAPGSCCYGQLSKAHFLQGSLSFESQHWGPPVGPTELSAQHRCCPHFPAPLTQKAFVWTSPPIPIVPHCLHLRPLPILPPAHCRPPENLFTPGLCDSESGNCIHLLQHRLMKLLLCFQMGSQELRHILSDPCVCSAPIAFSIHVPLS